METGTADEAHSQAHALAEGDTLTQARAPHLATRHTTLRGIHSKHKGKQPAGAPGVSIEDGRVVMRVGGVIQSVKVDEQYTFDVWDAMLPRRCPANALILGLGGGTIATLMSRRWGALPIVGVECDPQVVALARREFGLDALPNLHIVTDDAFAFVRRSAHSLRAKHAAHQWRQQVRAECDADDKNSPQTPIHRDATDVYTLCEPCDAICVDLYTAGKMAHGVLSGAFLRDVASLLTPDGEIMLNLWQSSYLEDHLRRIRKAITIGELVLVDDNVVVHGKPA